MTKGHQGIKHPLSGFHRPPGGVARGSGVGREWVGSGSGVGREWVGSGSGVGREWVGSGSGVGREVSVWQRVLDAQAAQRGLRLGFAVRGVSALYLPVCSMSNLQRPPEQVRSFLDAMLDMPTRAAIPLEVTVAGNPDALPGDYRDRYLDLAKTHRAGFPVHLLLAWSLDDEVLRLTNRFRHSRNPVSAAELAAAADVSEPIDLIIRTGRVRAWK